MIWISWVGGISGQGVRTEIIFWLSFVQFYCAGCHEFADQGRPDLPWDKGDWLFWIDAIVWIEKKKPLESGSSGILNS